MTARHLLAADLPAAAETLATAFADDPMMTWMTGDATSGDRVQRSASAFFVPSVGAGLRRGHVYGAPGDSSFDAVALWIPPDVTPFDKPEGIELVTTMSETYGDAALGRMVALDALTGEFHPHDRAHFYLFLLGAATPGRGAGEQVLTSVLDRCDADGLGAYLESSNPRNVGFYERFGFESVWEETPEPGAPLITGMWRDAPSGDRAS